jgi:predicted phage terminase large subunit-like protein
MQTGKWEELILPTIQPTTRVFEIVEGGAKVKFVAGRILQPSSHDKDDLAQLKKEMGEFDFEAQFNQSPLPPGGATFREEWIKRNFKQPSPSQIEAIIQSWDTAYEGDEHNAWSVCTTWAKCPNGYHLLDVWRGRPSFPDLRKKVYELKQTWKAKMVIVEKKASGISLIQEIEKLEGQKWLVNISPQTSKVERAEQQAVKFEQGKVWLPAEAPWLAAYEAELFSFPHCKFNDQVDSTVQLLTASDYSSFKNRLKIL